MTTEATVEAPAPPPADPRTICRLTSAELREFVRLERRISDSDFTPEEKIRSNELWHSLSLPGGDSTSGVLNLASALAAALERAERHATIDVSFDRTKLETAIEDAIAGAQMPLLVILPSGKVVNLDGLRYTEVSKADPAISDPWFQLHFGNTGSVHLSDPHDVAAMRAYLHRLAKSIEAPTLKGDDADSDGRTGE